MYPIKIYGINKEEIIDFNKSIEPEISNIVLFDDDVRSSNFIKWVGGAFIVIYIIKPFIDSYLKELGKDFYGLTKNLVKNIFNQKVKDTSQEIKSELLIIIESGIYELSFVIRQVDLKYIEDMMQEMDGVITEYNKNGSINLNIPIIIRKRYYFNTINKKWLNTN